MQGYHCTTAGAFGAASCRDAPPSAVALSFVRRGVEQVQHLLLIALSATAAGKLGQPVRQLAVTPEMSKKVHSTKNPIPAMKSNQVRTP